MFQENWSLVLFFISSNHSHSLQCLRLAKSRIGCINVCWIIKDQVWTFCSDIFECEENQCSYGAWGWAKYIQPGNVPWSKPFKLICIVHYDKWLESYSQWTGSRKFATTIVQSYVTTETTRIATAFYQYY